MVAALELLWLVVFAWWTYQTVRACFAKGYENAEAKVFVWLLLLVAGFCLLLTY